MSPHQQSPSSSRASKLNAINSFRFKARESLPQTADDNLENSRPFSSAHQKQENHKPNRSRRRQTLNEKSFNSLMIDCFDETSNNSQGNSDYSVESSLSSASSNGLNAYKLNLKSVELVNKVLKIKRKVLDQTGTEALRPIEKEQSTVTDFNERVIVPNFRVKVIKKGFRIEGTEVSIFI